MIVRLENMHKLRSKVYIPRYLMSGLHLIAIGHANISHPIAWPARGVLADF